jgi:murein DD-endopeptidase MepM/ murein hydrolase activator NlpD
MRERRLLVVVLPVVLTAGGVSVALPAAAQESLSPTASASLTESASPSAPLCPTPSPSIPPSPSGSPTPSPSTSPSPSSSASPTPSPSACPSPSSGPSPSESPSPDASPTPSERGRHGDSLTAHRDKRLRHAEGRRHHRDRRWRGWAPDPRWGTYGTAVLDRAARRARHRGWTERRIADRIYAPFIVEGPATWSDSWGAPRWTGGYHPHHGQDVLCRYGAPVVAAETGTIRFGTDTLGGTVAYIDRDDGSFWYYAHLRSYARHLSSGDHVTAGRIIGRCGASGDASVPHVHFCLFTADGRAIDPMRTLIRRLRAAERGLPEGHHHDGPSVPRRTVTPHRIASRAASGRSLPLAVPGEPVDRGSTSTPTPAPLAAAAFMMIFGSALWAWPSRGGRLPGAPAQTL